MHTQSATRVMLAAAVALALALTTLTVLLVALPATAEPGAQGNDLIPTPTLIPVVEVDYVLTTVGGEEVAAQTFADQTVDNVSFTNMTMQIEFPNRVNFWVDLDAGDTEISAVELVIIYHNGGVNTQHFVSQEEEKRWYARFVPRVPAWAEFDFRWCVIDTAEHRTCTAPEHFVYVDTMHEWFRAETDHAILYWYGFGEANPGDIAMQFAHSVAVTHQRRVEGFGREMDYKPVVIVYPNVDARMEGLSWGLDEANLRPDATLGMALFVMWDDEIPAWIASCSYTPSADEMDPLVFTLNLTLDHVSTLGITALFVGDILERPNVSAELYNASWNNVNRGPDFWFYGQQGWFASPHGSWTYDERLQAFAASRPMPRLRRVFTEYDRPGADDCPAFTGDQGASFINWLMATYGGIDVHRQIVEAMIPTEDVPDGMPLEDAIAQVTGKPLEELENEWRTYLGLPPLE